MEKQGRNRETITVPTKVRRVNAVFALLLVVFFLIHAMLGAAFSYGVIGNELAIAAWVGVGLAAAHILASAATTVYMLRDTKRPPSDKKKRHQLLKWLTGVAVALLLLLHLTLGNLVDDLRDTIGVLIAVVLLASLAIHTYTGIKSLTRDLRASKSFRLPLRIGVIALSAGVGIAFLLVAL